MAVISAILTAATAAYSVSEQHQAGKKAASAADTAQKTSAQKLKTLLEGEAKQSSLESQAKETAQAEALAKRRRRTKTTLTSPLGAKVGEESLGTKTLLGA